MRRHGVRPIAARPATTFVCVAVLVSGATALALASVHRQMPSPSTPATQAGVVGPQVPFFPASPVGSGTGVVRGRVTRSDSGSPIPRVRVNVAGGSQNTITVLTDSDGTFEVPKLPAGQYRLSAYKTGFVTLGYGQRRPTDPFRTLALDEGEVLDDVDFELPPGGAIEGRVLDEFGEPIAAANVQVLRQRYAGWERRLMPEAMPAVTDDLGRFRVYGIPPGEYYLAASAPPPSMPGTVVMRAVALGAAVGTAPTYYPGTASAADAQPLTMGVGQEVAGIFIQIVPVQTATIAGTVRSSGGVPVSNATVMLGQANPGGGTSSRGVGLRPDGSFSFPNLPPGAYTVTARVGELEAAFVRVAINGGDATVSLVTGPLPRIRGRVSFDIGAPPADVSPDMVRITMAPSPGMPSMPTAPSDDWTFDVPGALESGRLRVLLRSADWNVKGVYHHGVDVTDRDLEFSGSNIDGVEAVLTQQVTDLSGTVSNERGERLADATVVAFAEDLQRWAPPSRFVRAARLDRDGRFSLRGLPPARYLLVALAALENGEETNPQVLEQLRPRGTLVTLGEGEARSVDLRLTGR